MLHLRPDEPLAVALVEAIRSGEVEALKRMLDEKPALATARIVDDDAGGAAAGSRTLLHVATDWPGHYPNARATVTALIEAGANVDAEFIGGHSETPLHWAASSDDLEALEALIDAGADLEAPGAVIGGGTPLDDAVAFGQWQAARRLVERGAQTKLWHAAALGLMPGRGGVLRQPAATRCRRGHGRLLVRLPRRAARARGLPLGARRRPQLDRLRRADPARRGAPKRRERACPVAPIVGGQVGRRAGLIRAGPAPAACSRAGAEPITGGRACAAGDGGCARRAPAPRRRVDRRASPARALRSLRGQ